MVRAGDGLQEQAVAAQQMAILMAEKMQHTDLGRTDPKRLFRLQRAIRDAGGQHVHRVDRVKEVIRGVADPLRDAGLSNLNCSLSVL
jgi:hypothetical protein